MAELLHNSNKMKNRCSIKLCTNLELCDTIPTGMILRRSFAEVPVGVNTNTAYTAKVKRSLGLTMYDIPNAVEELKQPRKYPPKAKIEAITDALKYFEVI